MFGMPPLLIRFIALMFVMLMSAVGNWDRQ